MVCKDVTICSVSYKSRSYLDLNWNLTAKLNKNHSFEWIVVENSGINSNQRIKFHNKRFRMYRGIPPKKNISAAGSYNHAHGLNLALKHVKTKFVLFLDPDFFIVRNDWISAITDYMIKNDLAFLGAPYHPIRFIKYRYFPSSTCLFVNLKKIDRRKLDFTPEINSQDALDSSFRKRKSRSHKIKTFFLKDLLKMNPFIYNACLRMALFFSYTFQRQNKIGSSRDTGYRIYRNFAKNKNIKYECFIPVFKDSDHKKDLIQKIAEFAISDDWCYVPKTKGYFSKVGFKEKGSYDIDKLGWEEYLWQEKPFGFHIQGVFQNVKTIDIDKLDKIFKSLSNQERGW